MAAPRVEDVEPGAAADDPEMVELRAFAAEVVSASGGVPRRSGYRPRLEPGGPALSIAPVTLLTDLGSGLVSSIRERPLRAAGAALVGCGVVAGAIFLLLPRDGALELAASLPDRGAAVATAPPPAVTSIPENLLKTTAPARPRQDPPQPPPAEAPPAAQAPPVARALPAPRAVPAPQPPPAPSAPPRVARSTTTKHVALPPARPSQAARPSKKVASLDRAAMIDGMQAIQPRVSECYREYRQKGVAMTSIEVGGDGKVTKVTVTGPLGRTRTGACVKAAVKTARFRGAGKFQYPLVLK
jgi:hypothetical protein